MLLEHEREKEGASSSPAPPIEVRERDTEKNRPCGDGADRKRNGIDFALTLTQQQGSLGGRGTFLFSAKCRHESLLVIDLRHKHTLPYCEAHSRLGVCVWFWLLQRVTSPTL